MKDHKGVLISKRKKRQPVQWINDEHYVWDDAGRSKVRPDERNDCVVRALSLTCGLTYSQVHRFAAKEMGRKDHRALDLALWGLIFPNFSLAEFGSTSMCSILPKLDKEKAFLIEKSGHIFAFIKGKIHDTYYPKPLERVTYIWEVTKVGVEKMQDLVLSFRQS